MRASAQRECRLSNAERSGWCFRIARVWLTSRRVQKRHRAEPDEEDPEFARYFTHYPRSREGSMRRLLPKGETRGA